MAPILELIKKNAVPVNVMRSAALGSLPISTDETLEVLVYLTNNSLFGQDARMTLARWDAQSAMEALSKETTAPEVLLYFWQEQNRRPGLMPTLIENPAIPENLLMELAGDGSREIVNMLLTSARARALPSVVEALSANEYVTPAEAEALRSSIAKPVEHSNEFGVNLSGPLLPFTSWKEKLFFFGNYNIFRYTSATPTFNDLPHSCRAKGRL